MLTTRDFESGLNRIQNRVIGIHSGNCSSDDYMKLGEARKSNDSTDSDLLNIWLRRLLLGADIQGVKG